MLNMKTIFTYVLLISVYFFSFAQKTHILNTSLNKKFVSEKKIDSKNLPAHLSISEFILNTTIKNNEVNVGDKVVFDFKNFSNKEGTVTFKHTDVNNVTSYICKFTEFEFSQAFISVNNKEYLVSIELPEQNRKLTTHISNDRLKYYLVELDTDNLDYKQCNDSLLKSGSEPQFMQKTTLPIQDGYPLQKESELEETPQEFEEFNSSSSCNSLGFDDSASLKVLIVYTQEALNFAGSQAAMNNLVAQSITRANNASINSNLGMSFTLAHAELTTYVEDIAGSGTDLDRLRNKTDGYMDNVHTLRNTHNADFVHLFSFISDTGGLGYVLNTLSGREDLGFALSRVQQLSFTDTFIHELGHNMSASHASGQSVQPGPTAWSDWPGNTWTAGWRFQGNNGTYYTSIMAYNSGSSWPDGIGSTNISYFSSPLLTFQGQPIGNAASGDNTRSLKTVKQVVSKYRDEITAQYCIASGNNPSNLNLAISNLSLNGLTNPSTWAAFNDFSFKRTCLTKGETYPMTVNVAGGFSGAKLWIWIDWNNDFDFNDTDEVVLNSATGTALQYSVNVTAPLSAVIGSLRMRIRYEVATISPASSPCGTSQFGEVEDYTVVVEEAFGTEEDTDADGVSDLTDLDSDNDGVLDANDGKGTIVLNRALTGTPTQSSTDFGGDASRGIDGNTNGAYNSNSVTHTSTTSTTEYWQVDLNQTIDISEIVFFNRADCCADRISNVYVLVADTPFPSNSADLAGALANADFTYQFPANQAPATTTLPVNKVGRYVRLQKSGTNIDNALSIAELQVFGTQLLDTDGDGRPNYLDLDSDNDGIPDNVEAQRTFGYQLPANDTPALYLANSGINSAYIVSPLVPVDSDGDATPDIIDTDSDNDGMTDLVESFNASPSGIFGTNGLFANAEFADNYTDVNGIAHNGTTFTLKDSDNDVPNGSDYDYRDIPQTEVYSGTHIISSVVGSNIVVNKADAYLNIISSNSGVVITRVNGVATIVNPVEGMIVYDTLDNIFKVNTTGTAGGWRAFGN